MEVFCRRFPDVTELILNNLEVQSLFRSIEASRKIAEISKNKLFWIRKIKCTKNIQDFDESWKPVIEKLPDNVMKQFAISIQNFKNSPFSKDLALLSIFADTGNWDLFKKMFETIKNQTVFKISLIQKNLSNFVRFYCTTCENLMKIF